MRSSAWLACLLLASAVVSGVSGAELRYEGSSGVLPNAPGQQWGYQALGIPPATTTAVAAGGVTTLDSTGQASDHAGYTTHIPNLFSAGFSYANTIPLDRAPGFEVDFTVKLLSESHSSTDRAGFSVIALSSDATHLGIELGFWQNEIWAQNAGFTHGESSGPFNTTAALVNYRLNISGTTYTLFENNSQILTGSLRDYSAFNSGDFNHPHFPYDQPNFVFFGDDTSSAAASVQIAELVVVPEPAAIVSCTLGATIVAALGMVRWKSRRAI